jgi:hypothetical protein
LRWWRQFSSGHGQCQGGWDELAFVADYSGAWVKTTNGKLHQFTIEQSEAVGTFGAEEVG